MLIPIDQLSTAVYEHLPIRGLIQLGGDPIEAHEQARRWQIPFTTSFPDQLDLMEYNWLWLQLDGGEWDFLQRHADCLPYFDYLLINLYLRNVGEREGACVDMVDEFLAKHDFERQHTAKEKDRRWGDVFYRRNRTSAFQLP